MTGLRAREPYPTGPTTTSNLYPLCRGHHRLKTTGRWNYLPLDRDTIVWVSPQGQGPPTTSTD